jgi:hypothetical protein
MLFASGHTATNTPDLFRTPKLTVAGPGQYWGGGPPGKPFGCCWLFCFSGFSCFLVVDRRGGHIFAILNRIYGGVGFLQIILTWLALGEDHAARSRRVEQLIALRGL